MRSNKFLVFTIFEICKKYKWKLSFVGLVAFSFIVTQGLLISSVLSLIRGQNDYIKISYINTAFILDNHFLIWSALSLLGVVSVTLVFISKVVSVSIMIDYERYCVIQVCKKILNSNNLSLQISKKEFLILCSKDCRFGGRMAFEVSNSIMPVGVCLILIPVMLFLDPMLTLIILSLVSFTILTQVLFRPKVARTARSMETLAKLDAVHKSEVYDKFGDLIKGESAETLAEIQSIIPDKDFMNVYRQRLILPHLGIYIGGANFVLVLSAIILDFFLSDTYDQSAIDHLYFTAIAIFCFSQMRSLSKIFVNLSVFNEYMSRAMQFIITGTYHSQVGHDVLMNADRDIIEDENFN